MALELTEVKNFLRCEHDEDDELIKIYMSSAEEYVKSACVYSENLETSKAKTLLLMLISDYYENRTAYGQGSYSHNITSMITQLRLETEMEADE